MIWILDRITEGTAYLEGSDGRLETVCATLLPDNVCAGDVLRRDGNAYRVDPDATQARRAAIRQKMRRAFGRSSQSDTDTEL